MIGLRVLGGALIALGGVLMVKAGKKGAILTSGENPADTGAGIEAQAPGHDSKISSVNGSSGAGDAGTVAVDRAEVSTTAAGGTNEPGASLDVLNDDEPE